MRTKILGETRMVALLTANAENTGESLSIRAELTVAYDEFTDRLVRLIEDENSIADMLHCLYYIRAEFHALQQEPGYKAEKKCALLPMPRQVPGIGRIGDRVD